MIPSNLVGERRIWEKLEDERNTLFKLIKKLWKEWKDLKAHNRNIDIVYAHVAKLLPELPLLYGDIDARYFQVIVTIPFSFEEDKKIRKVFDRLDEWPDTLSYTNTRDRYDTQVNWVKGNRVQIEYVVRYYLITWPNTGSGIASLEIRLDSRLPGTTCQVNKLRDRQDVDPVYEIICGEAAKEMNL